MKLVLLILALLICFWQIFKADEVATADGILVPSSPKQLTTDRRPFQYQEFTIQPQASFELQARVLSTEHYFADAESALSPVDLALGWGPMSSNEVLNQIDVQQGGRFYRWRVDEFPIPRRDIERHSANMHIIPADQQINQTLKAIKKGHIIRLKGYLVRVTKADGWHWQSSLTRDDTGNGACELIWVEMLDIQS